MNIQFVFDFVEFLINLQQSQKRLYCHLDFYVVFQYMLRKFIILMNSIFLYLIN